MSMSAEHMIQAPTVADLLQGYVDAPTIPVHGIASDSRLLREGFLSRLISTDALLDPQFVEAAGEP